MNFGIAMRFVIRQWEWKERKKKTRWGERKRDNEIFIYAINRIGGECVRLNLACKCPKMTQNDADALNYIIEFGWISVERRRVRINQMIYSFSICYGFLAYAIGHFICRSNDFFFPPSICNMTHSTRAQRIRLVYLVAPKNVQQRDAFHFKLMQEFASNAVNFYRCFYNPIGIIIFISAATLRWFVAGRKILCLLSHCVQMFGISSSYSFGPGTSLFSPCTIIVVGSTLLHHRKTHNVSNVRHSTNFCNTLYSIKASKITHWPQCRQCANGSEMAISERHSTANCNRAQKSAEMLGSHTHTHTNAIDKPESNLHAKYLVRHNFVPEMPSGSLYDAFCRSSRIFNEIHTQTKWPFQVCFVEI